MKSESISKEIGKIYADFYKAVPFEQIDHAPSQLIPIHFQIQQNCLIINFQAFEVYYPHLMKTIDLKTLDETLKNASIQEVNGYCNILLSMNGQNDRAWNVKKIFLQKNELNLEEELKFNAATCRKFKKSSSYYSYRIKIYQKLLQSGKQIKFQEILTIENDLITKVLSRFFRNYYCWMYRIRLVNLLLFKSQQQNSLIIQQIAHVHKFLEKNNNDYSAYSYLINFRRKHPINKGQEILWAKDLLQFCKLGYQSKESYRNLQLYLKYVQEHN